MGAACTSRDDLADKLKFLQNGEYRKSLSGFLGCINSTASALV